MTSSLATLVAFLICCIFIANNFSSTHGFSIRLISTDQLDKSLFTESLYHAERYQRIPKTSITPIHQPERAASLSSATEQPVIEYEPYTLQPRITFYRSTYFVTSLTIGSHSYTPFLLVDTGSDETWIQCEGCTECFRTRQGNFNRSQSESYRALPCDDPRCFPRICKHDFCMYDQKYLGSGSYDIYSRGTVGLDTFSFRGSGGAIKSFTKTIFGCGLQNHNFDWDHIGGNNIIAGILGLGIGHRSILWQYMNETKLRMSYCLPRSSSPTGTSTVLRFGDEAQIRGRVWTTRLLPSTNKFEVNLMGITVAGTRLKLDPTIFRTNPNRIGRLILDSGCQYSRLVQTAYNAMRAKMVQFFMRKYRWHPSPPQPRGFDLCYSVPSGNYTFPTLTFHFEGADLFLDTSNVFGNIPGGVCLIMMPISDGGTSILGTFQQANVRFLFDVRSLTLSFVHELCRYN